MELSSKKGKQLCALWFSCLSETAIMSADHVFLSPSGVYTVLLLGTHKLHIMIRTIELFKRSA